MAPLAQPHPQDTCGIGSGPFLHWGGQKVGLELIEWRWSDLYSITSTSTLFCHPTCPSLSSTPPQTVYILHVAGHTSPSHCVVQSSLMPLHCRHPSHRYCCRQWRQCQHCRRCCCCHRCCSPLHCHCCHYCCHPCRWHCCRCWCRHCQHRCLVLQGSGLTRLRSSHPCQVAYLVSLCCLSCFCIFVVVVVLFVTF